MRIREELGVRVCRDRKRKQSQRLSSKSRRVSEYPRSPEAVVRMGGGRSKAAKKTYVALTGLVALFADFQGFALG